MNVEAERRVIFCGGVHGVGKTTLLSRVASIDGWVHAKASQLIESARGGQRNWSQSKRVEAVSENQRLLVEALMHDDLSNSKILLDGHFTLMRTSGEVEEICPSTFVDIRPSILLLCECSTDVVENRLQKRGTSAISRGQIKQMQVAERGHAHTISEALQIPLTVVPMHDLEAASHFAKSIATVAV